MDRKWGGGWHHIKRQRDFSIPSPVSVRQKQTPKDLRATGPLPERAPWPLAMGYGFRLGRGVQAGWLQVGCSIQACVKQLTVVLASNQADPAEPGQSHPPSPDRALLGCDGADTACPELAERRLLLFTLSKKDRCGLRSFSPPSLFIGLFKFQKKHTYL